MPGGALLLQPGPVHLPHHTREDYIPYYRDDRKYFELATFYGGYAKDWRDRRLPMEHRATSEALAVYQLWQERNPE